MSSQITFRIDPQLKKRIEKAALNDGRKMAGFIRHVITEHLDRAENKNFINYADKEQEEKNETR